MKDRNPIPPHHQTAYFSDLAYVSRSTKDVLTQLNDFNNLLEMLTPENYLRGTGDNL